MADLAALALGTFTNVNDTAITGTDPVLELIAAANDASYVADTANTTHTGTARFELADMPADFGSMDTLAIQLRYARQSGSLVNAWSSLSARVFQADGVTPLTNEATIASGITTTTPTNSGAISFTGVDTAASKAAWDGAVVHILFSITKSMGGDTIEERVFAGELTGTYTAQTSTPYSAELSAASVGITAQAVTRLNAFTGQLSTAAVGVTGQALTRLSAWAGQLSPAAVAIAGQPVSWSGLASFVAELSTASFAISGQAVTRLNAWRGELTTASVTVTGQAVSRFSAYLGELSSASLSIAGQPVTFSGIANYVAELTAASFAISGQALTRLSAYTAQLGTASIGFTARALSWTQATVMALSAASMSIAGHALGYGTGVVVSASKRVRGMLANVGQMMGHR